MKLSTFIIVIPMLAYLLTIFTAAVLGRDLTQQLFGNTVEELWIMWTIFLAVIVFVKSRYSRTKYKQG
jgi:ABC-type transport system involved in cytochrome bd biosynthesis fused ATPase/permease subunit